MKQTAIFGLIGYPLGHSFSKKYFSEKFENEDVNAVYLNYEWPNLENYLSTLKGLAGLKGLNVTIPYKQEIIKYLDDVDEVAKAIGAVNVIHITNGKWIGYNTDWIGFKNSLQPFLKPRHKHALVLGNGGAAQAIKYALGTLDIEYISVVRNAVKENGVIDYQSLKISTIQDNLILVNTTPLGTYPNVAGFPDIPYQGIGEHHICYDLVYNPEMTTFLSLAKANNALIINGKRMLELQAEAAWEIWNKN